LVQSVLFFALGFLCAVFLVSLIAPAVWRRAVVLTRRRLEASLPLTPAEIQADKDRVRAEYAMTTRKLEMTVKSLQEKTAEQLVEIGRGREALKGLAVEKKDKNQALSDLQAKTAELRQREEDLQKLSDRLAQTERTLEKRALELQKLEQMYDDASFSSSNRQIELVARESELEKLANDIAVLRSQRKEADRRSQDIVSESKAAAEALKAEKKKAADLDIMKLWEEPLRECAPEILDMAMGWAQGATQAGVPMDYWRALAIWSGRYAPAKSPAFAWGHPDEAAGLHPAFLSYKPAAHVPVRCSGVCAWGEGSADGSLVVGDSHHYNSADEVFAAERIYTLILDEYAAVIGHLPPPVRERWNGVYTVADNRVLLIEEPAPNVRLVLVTSGVGASIGFAIGEEVIEGLFHPRSHTP